MNNVMGTMGVMSLCISLPLFYLVCKLISLAYYKELITAARVWAACSLLFVSKNGLAILGLKLNFIK